MIREEALEPALCFMRKLWALDQALGSTSKRMHDQMGITAKQRMILKFVGEYPSITAVELATMLHLEKGTLSLALRRLETPRLFLQRLVRLLERRAHRDTTDKEPAA
jgi:DNA-binding MarR family transcriptional regulator